jgi:hypothetical protein
MVAWSKIKKRRNIKWDASFEELVGATKRAVIHMSVLLEEGYEDTGYSWMNSAAQWTCDHDDAMPRMDTTSVSTIKQTTHYSNFAPMFHHDNLCKGIKQ